MDMEWLNALWGGLLIGIAVSLMLLWNGRVTGISGILYGLVNPRQGDLVWRLCFVGGLIMGGFILALFGAASFGEPSLSVDWTIPVAGLLVGFGTVLGSGCTSGHGVCGISRCSLRSLLATALFILSGVASVAVWKYAGVSP